MMKDRRGQLSGKAGMNGEAERCANSGTLSILPLWLRFLMALYCALVIAAIGILQP